MPKPALSPDKAVGRSNEEGSERKYRAPALEKGLDILELLAKEGVPMTTSQMASRLGRSVSELFRMVLTLEYRGYIGQSSDGEGYELTNHLFALGMAQAPTRTLLDVALPVMKELAEAVGQACHMAVPSDDQVVVLARIESPRDMGFVMRLGYRRRVIDSTSGLLFYGLRTDAEKAAWRPQLAGPDEKKRWSQFAKEAEQAAKQRYVRHPSGVVEGVMDLASPVIGREGPIAVLVVPFIKCKPLLCSEDEVLERLRSATAKIGNQLGGL